LFAARSPAAAVPLPIMNTAFSFAATSPDWFSDASPPSVFALVRNCRSDPRPVSLILTTVSKLNPKSTPEMAPVLIVTGAKDCAVPAIPAVNTPVVVFITAPAAPLGASATAGFWPPT
jgi:hypothetical protein